MHKKTIIIFLIISIICLLLIALAQILSITAQNMYDENHTYKLENMDYEKYSMMYPSVHVSEHWSKLKNIYENVYLTSEFILIFVPELLNYSLYSIVLFSLMDEFGKKSSSQNN